MKVVARQLVLFIVVLIPSLAFAQRPDSEVTAGADRFSKATLAIWNWVMTFDPSGDKFVAKEDRRQFIQHLRELNDSLYHVESAKLSLVYEIKNTSGSSAEIERMSQMVTDLVGTVDKLKNTIGGVAGLLREQQKVDGEKCEALLTEAILTRKEWVSELATHPDLLRDAGTRARLVESGETAVKALRDASVELSKVIDRLSRS